MLVAHGLGGACCGCVACWKAWGVGRSEAAVRAGAARTALGARTRRAGLMRARACPMWSGRAAGAAAPAGAPQPGAGPHAGGGRGRAGRGRPRGRGRGGRRGGGRHRGGRLWRGRRADRARQARLRPPCPEKQASGVSASYSEEGAREARPRAEGDEQVRRSIYIRALNKLQSCMYVLTRMCPCCGAAAAGVG